MKQGRGGHTTQPMGFLRWRESSSISFQSRLAMRAWRLCVVWVSQTLKRRLCSAINSPNPPGHLLRDLELALNLLGPAVITQPDQLKHGLIH